MTAEIAILNVEAVALAADSAVTVRVPDDVGEAKVKIFNSANKLLALSKRHPVGLMVYGSASVMGVPWETIVKEFRRQLGETEYNRLEEYATALFTHLNLLADQWFPQELQDEHIRSVIASVFWEVRSEILEAVARRLERTPTLSENQLRRIGGGVVLRSLEAWDAQADLDTYVESERREVWSSLTELVEEVRQEVLEDYPFSDTAEANLLRVGQLSLTKFRPRDGERTGVVVAGFGRADLTPSLESFEISGVGLGRIRFVRDELRSQAVGSENPVLVLPFAQSQVVAAFMEGMDPELRHYLSLFRDELMAGVPATVVESLSLKGVSTRAKVESELANALDSVVESLEGFLEHLRFMHYAQPVVETITHMPRDELARVAETLVSLTSFRQRVTMSDETVGGPVDVAVISKGDGFIWIKRKHYFNPELNQRYIAQLYQGRTTDGQERAQQEQVG